MEENGRETIPVSDRQRAGEDNRRVPDEITFLQLFSALLRRRRLLIGLPVALATVLVAVALVLPRTYTATAAFIPQGGQEVDASRLVGLAAQFGFNVPTGGPGHSPRFYATLLESREILSAVARNQYAVPEVGEGVRGTLMEIWGIQGDDPEARIAEATERLEEAIRTRVDGETGLVAFSVRTRWPSLSRSVAERLLALVNEFNLETRQTQALAERRFIGARLEDAQRELRDTEATLQTFLERNRRYDNAPDLRFEFDRLQREVALRQQLFGSLSQSFEQARIEEVRNTPVITVVEPPIRPVGPDSRRVPVAGLVGLLLGGFLATVWIVGHEIVRQASQESPEDYGELTRAGREARAEITSAVRRVQDRVRGLVGASAASKDG